MVISSFAGFVVPFHPNNAQRGKTLQVFSKNSPSHAEAKTEGVCSVFFPEQAAGGLEQQPGVHASAAQLEVHGQLLAQCAHGLSLFHGLSLADRNLLQAVQIAAQPAAVVDDHRVAGKRQIARKHHRAVGCGAAGRTGDGVQLCGVRAAALLAVRYFNLPVASAPIRQK